MISTYDRMTFSRYGTLPKGARIGAYLESMRASGVSEVPDGSEGEEVVLPAGSSSQDNTMERQQQQHIMLRSNSSHGGFNTGKSSNSR